MDEPVFPIQDYVGACRENKLLHAARLLIHMNVHTLMKSDKKRPCSFGRVLPSFLPSGLPACLGQPGLGVSSITGGGPLFARMYCYELNDQSS